MAHTLLTIPFSHFCEKARWSLEVAGVSFEEEGHSPVLHRMAVRRRGGRGSVPVLLVEGGRVLDDSPLIVQFADEKAPQDRKLLASSGAARQEALDLERELDLHFAPHVRRFVYFHMLPHRTKTLSLFHAGIPRLEQVVASTAFPVIRAVMRRFMRIDEAGVQRSIGKVWKTLDGIGERLSDGRPYLMGERFGAADIAFASFAAPLVVPPQHPRLPVMVEALPGAFVSELQRFRDHPAGQFAERMYRERRAIPAH